MVKTNTIILLRNVSIIFLALIGLQFWLGMSINLELNLPVKNLSAIGSIEYYAGHFGFILAHVVNGILLLLTALVYLAIALRSKVRPLEIIGIVGTVSIVSAIGLGIMFLVSGQFFGWSIGMAMSAVSALIVYAIGLYFIGAHIDGTEPV